MKTYEITFEEIKENCKHHTVDGSCEANSSASLRFFCKHWWAANQCFEATCPIIKKLKEAKK
jgi:hypothetical protein